MRFNGCAIAGERCFGSPEARMALILFWAMRVLPQSAG